MIIGGFRAPLHLQAALMKDLKKKSNRSTGKQKAMTKQEEDQ